MNKHTTSDPLVLSDECDAVALVPHLLGFHPTDSVVVIACHNGSIEVTARFDIAQCHRNGPLKRFLTHLVTPERVFLIVAFCADVAACDDALARFEILLGAPRVLISVYTDGERVWRRGRAGWRWLKPGNLDLEDALADSGKHVLDNRDQLAAMVAGPPADRIEAVALACAEALHTWSRRPLAERLDRARRLVDTGIADPSALDWVNVAELACLVGDIPVRDEIWGTMDRASADGYVALFLRVLDGACEGLAVPVLALTGAAAWLTGDGALLACCLERGLSIDPTYTMLRLLEQTLLSALPPTAWDDFPHRAGATPAPAGLAVAA
jgi:hypothetical protein